MKPLYTPAAERGPGHDSPRPPRHGTGPLPSPSPRPGGSRHGLGSPALLGGTAGPRAARSRPAIPSRPVPSPPGRSHPAAGAQPVCSAPHLRVDRRAHAREGVRRGGVVGEAVPSRGSAAAARGGRLVLSSEARVHHVVSVRTSWRCGDSRAPLGTRRGGGRLRVSLCPVRAARLCAPPPGLPLLLSTARRLSL